MCIKVDLGIKVEILPVVYKAGNYDPNAEPFRLYRSGSGSLEDGYARYHQQLLTLKNGPNRTGGNFIPMIKVLKHLRSLSNLAAVSFHLECLLNAVPDQTFRGAPADYIPAVLNHIASISAATWYIAGCLTPCGERNILSAGEWGLASWQVFHNAVMNIWAPLSTLANHSPDRALAIQHWRALLGADYFPLEVQ